MFFLKMSTLSDFCIFTGRIFHKVGAAMLKPRLPYVTESVLGTFSSSLLFDLRHLVCVTGEIISVTYWGARPCNALYVKSNIL